jgi:hypothetical protein
LFLKVTDEKSWIRIRNRQSVPGKRYEFENPDPHPDQYKNVTDPEHWFEVQHTGQKKIKLK